MITTYFYQQLLRNYQLQFCAIFAGLKVKTGKGECDEDQFITCPIHMGSKDRVVASLTSGNTQNRVFSLPLMAASMSALDLAPERRKGVGTTDSRVHLPAGGVFPTDLRVVKRYMPIPYNMTMELSIYASNTDQMQQILEQILVLFDPTVNIQTNDKLFDWTKLTSVELTGVGNEENYPAGGDRRIIVWTLTFIIPIWLSIPMDIKDEVVRKIIIQIGDLEGFNVTEFDDEGNLQPFTIRYDKFDDGDPRPTIIDGDTFAPPDPPDPTQ